MPRASSAERIPGTRLGAVVDAARRSRPSAVSLAHLASARRPRRAASACAVHELDDHGLALELALQLLGVPSTTTGPRLTIASRSASASASSR